MEQEHTKTPIWTGLTIGSIIGSIAAYSIGFGGWYIVISAALGFLSAAISGDSEPGSNNFVADWAIATIIIAFLSALGAGLIGIVVSLINDRY